MRCEGVLRNHESVPTPQFIERIKKVRFNKTVSELSLFHFSDVIFFIDVLVFIYIYVVLECTMSYIYMFLCLSFNKAEMRKSVRVGER